MVKSRSKSEILSETTKSYLQEVWIKETFGREKIVSTPAMQKGTIVESDSMTLVEQVSKETYFKNNKKLENGEVCGTPDIIGKDFIIDMKSCWDLWSFAKVDEDSAKKAYYYQVLSYMWLTDTKKASLIFTLVNTPDNLVFDEYNKLAWRMDKDEAEKLVRNNHTFDDIPAEMRMKKYDFEYNSQDVFELTEKVLAARVYLEQFKL